MNRPVNRSGETILVVDDEPAVLKLASSVLVAQGYAVLRAGSPAEAIEQEAAHAGAIDLLLSDVVLPEMNGWELSKRLLAARPTLKRLFMSGYPAGVLVSRGQLEDGAQLIPKPFSIADLAAKVREVLDGG